jgi:hypothetical protein
MLDQIYGRLFQRPAAGITRRRSVRALGGAALAATTFALPERATARKKKKGKTCQDRERQRCAIDAEACHDTTLRTCTVIGGCLYTLVCCDECTATGFLTCALGGT